MKSKNSVKDKYNARIVFEIEQQTKDDLQEIAKTKGKASADILRELTEKYVNTHIKKAQ